MLRMSYSAHFLSDVRLSVHPLTFSNDFSSEATEPILLKFHNGASLGWGNKSLLKWLQYVEQDGHHAHIW